MNPMDRDAPIPILRIDEIGIGASLPMDIRQKPTVAFDNNFSSRIPTSFLHDPIGFRSIPARFDRILTLGIRYWVLNRDFDGIRWDTLSDCSSWVGYHFQNLLRFEQNTILSETFSSCFKKWF